MPSPTPSPSRFYKTAGVCCIAAGWGVSLDGRIPKTPAGSQLILPSQALAALVASEWEAQETKVEISSMPATRLAFASVDRTPKARGLIADEVARFASSDLICCYADVPRRLTERQEQLWGPWLDWARRDLRVDLKRTVGLGAQRQPQESLSRIKDLALLENDFQLSALVFAAALFSSAVLAFAVRRQALLANEAFGLSRLDESFQAEEWGLDAEAAASEASLRSDAAVLDPWFQAL